MGFSMEVVSRKSGEDKHLTGGLESCGKQEQIPGPPFQDVSSDSREDWQVLNQPGTPQDYLSCRDHGDFLTETSDLKG